MSWLTSRALTAPGYVPDWHIGVRVAKTGKLIAFISGIKIDVRVRSRYVFHHPTRSLLSILLLPFPVFQLRTPSPSAQC
jgi:hypothetical protein